MQGAIMQLHTQRSPPKDDSAAASFGPCCIEGQQAHPGRHRTPCCDVDRQHRRFSSFKPSAAPCCRYATIILRLHSMWHMYMYTQTMHWSEADGLALLCIWLPEPQQLPHTLMHNVSFESRVAVSEQFSSKWQSSSH